MPVSLTETGAELMRDGRAVLVPIEEAMLEGMTEREILLFGMLLDVVVGNLERAFWSRRFASGGTPVADDTTE